jgi:hypothetical protein
MEIFFVFTSTSLLLADAQMWYPQRFLEQYSIEDSRISQLDRGAELRE